MPARAGTFRPASLLGVDADDLMVSKASRQLGPRWARIGDAAEYAGVPTRTLRGWISSGLLPAYRLGPKIIQIDLNDVDAMRRRIPTAADYYRRR